MDSGAMRGAPLRVCAEPGCSELVPLGRCVAHARARSRPNADTRKWYHLARWRRLRLAVLAEAAHTCAVCHRVSVDHVVDHHGDARLFWDRSNLQALCHPCHSTKTNATTPRAAEIR